MPSSPALYNGSVTNMSRVDTGEKRDADEEFARFDQGPMQDMPGAMPRDSRDYDDDASEVPESPTAPRYNTRAAALLDPNHNHEQATPNEGFVTPTERTEQVNDAASELSVDEQPPPPVLTQDRWAQIRENAAKRAARASEEQSMQSRPRTEDDGETSGEESEHHPKECHYCQARPADICL